MNKLLGVMAGVTALTANAAGFWLDDHSARAQGMGGAVSALVDDASGIFYNPAGITNGKGLDVMLGDTLIIPSLSYKGLDGQSTSMNTGVNPPPHVYIAAGLTDDLSLGVGVYTPFGAAVDWPDKWAGRYLATQSALQTFDFSPQIAYRVHPRFKIGIGADIVKGTVQIGRDVNFVDSSGSVLLGGSSWGYGVHAGVQVEMVKDVLFFGASYRSPMGMKFDGRAHFEGVPAEFQSQVADQKITARVTLPQVATFGFGWKPMSNLRFGLEAEFVSWSSFPELKIEFEDPQLTVPQRKEWRDTVAVHVGGEYDINKSFSVRLGFVYDPTPTPQNTLTPDLPDGDRLKFNVGLGWRSSFGLRADLGYTYVAILDSKSTALGFGGTYSGGAQVIGITLGYRIGPSAPEATTPPPVSGETPPAQMAPAQ